MADPVATVARIYAALRRASSSPDAEAAMRRYLADQPRGVHGRHAYDAGALGLDPGALEERFAAYRAHFAVAREALH